MNICFVNDEQNIDLIKKGSLWIKAEPGWEKEDIILYTDSFVFFEQEDVSGKACARKAIDLSGTTMSAVEIFRELFETYYESKSVDETLNKYETVTTEEFCDSVISIVDRVKKHKKISEKEEKILLVLFCGEKSKKRIVKEGICSYKEIDEAYYKFMQEIQWCYGFRNQINTHRAEQFNAGELCFCYSLKDFADMHLIDEHILKKIVFTVIDCQKSLEKPERDFITSAIEKDNYENRFSVAERERLNEIVNKIIKYFYECEKCFYRIEAKQLIENKITHIHDIHKYCTINALDYWKTIRAIEKLGVKPNHHIRRRKHLTKIFDEDNT